MPGFKFAYNRLNVHTPQKAEQLIGKSTSLYAGDVIALTTNATYSLNSTRVVRPLLAADKTAHYLQGSPVAGILGVIMSGATSNALGVVTSNPQAAGGIVYSLPSMASGVPGDPNTGQDRIIFYPFAGGNVFLATLDATSSAATPLLNDTLCGLILTGTAPTQYTIHTGAASADQCLRIIKCDESDPLYGSVGGRVFVEAVSSFEQITSGVAYSSN